jgi:hypothetical protein
MNNGIEFGRNFKRVCVGNKLNYAKRCAFVIGSKKYFKKNTGL